MEITLYLLLLLVASIALFIKFYVGGKPTKDLSVFDYKPESVGKEGKEGKEEREGKESKSDASSVVPKDSSSSSLRQRNKPHSEDTTSDTKTKEVEQSPLVDKVEVTSSTTKEPVDIKKVEKAEEKVEEKIVKVEEKIEVEEKKEKTVQPEDKDEEKEKENEDKEDEDKEDEDEEDVDDEDDDDDDDDDDDEDEDDEDKASLQEVVNGSVVGKGLAVSVSLQGKRPNNEDRVVLQSLDKVHFCGIFDGHDGAKASNYCAKYLVKNITSQKSYAKSTTNAIKQGFLKTDKKFLDKVESGGTTAILAVYKEDSKDLLVANVGDSRCVASVAGTAVALSTDHKPNLPEETERISKTLHEVQVLTEIVHGQRVKVARVDGILAVSRAMGDADFKDDPDKKPHEQAVSCVPEILPVKVTGSHEFVVLACDGLWDVLSNQEVVDFVKSKLTPTTTKEELVTITKSLVSHAIEDKHSTDNVTALILKF